MYDHPVVPALRWKKQKAFTPRPNPPKSKAPSGSQSARRAPMMYRYRRYKKLNPIEIYKSLSKHCHIGSDQIELARTLDALQTSSWRVHHHKNLFPLKPDTEYMRKNKHFKILDKIYKF